MDIRRPESDFPGSTLGIWGAGERGCAVDMMRTNISLSLAEVTEDRHRNQHLNSGSEFWNSKPE
jgi:hypothetical protein